MVTVNVQIFRRNTWYFFRAIYILQMTRGCNQKYQVFPDISYKVRCAYKIAYHKYFGEIPHIFLPRHIYFKQPGNLIRNIGYFPDISNEVRCACVYGYHKYFGKIPNILHVFRNSPLHCIKDVSRKYLKFWVLFTPLVSIKRFHYIKIF